MPYRLHEELNTNLLTPAAFASRANLTVPASLMSWVRLASRSPRASLERRQEDHRIEAHEVLGHHITKVHLEGRNLRLRQELPPGVVAGVQPNDLVPRCLEEGREDLADVAAVSGNEDAHASTQGILRVSLRAWNASA
jgi:hypothetical protein